MLVFADHVSQFAAPSGAIRDSNTRGRRCPHGVRCGTANTVNPAQPNQVRLDYANRGMYGRTQGRHREFTGNNEQIFLAVSRSELLLLAGSVGEAIEAVGTGSSRPGWARTKPPLDSCGETLESSDINVRHATARLATPT
jgi:hypothetical protein